MCCHDEKGAQTQECLGRHSEGQNINKLEYRIQNKELRMSSREQYSRFDIQYSFLHRGQEQDKPPSQNSGWQPSIENLYEVAAYRRSGNANKAFAYFIPIYNPNTLY